MKKTKRNYFEEYVAINNIQQYFLHYPIESDFVVLFLHGGPGQTVAHLFYKTLLEDRKYSLVYYDQRGTGKTQSRNKTKPEDITIQTLLRDLDETIKYIRRQYPHKKLIIFGHSWGSILGIEYIKINSSKVDAFVGMGQVISFKYGEKVSFDYCYELMNKEDKKVLDAMGDFPENLTEKTIFDTITQYRKLQGKYQLTGYKEGNSKLLKLAMKSPVFSIKDIKPFVSGLKTNKNLLASLVQYDTRSYKEFSLPVYFLCGENDWQVPSVVVKEYYDTITAPKKALYWIKGAGHLTDLENPEACKDALNDICVSLK